MHGKALQSKYADNHAQSLDSGKYQYSKAYNRARKPVNMIAIVCRNLIFSLASLINAETAPFLGTKLDLYETFMLRRLLLQRPSL